MSRTAVFYPAPSAEAPVICARLWGAHTPAQLWEELANEIAERFGCEPDELFFQDAMWAAGERFADFVSLDGRVIGSINEHLTPREWTEFFATRVADPEALIRETISAARANVGG